MTNNEYTEDDLREMIREAGLRCTSARITVLDRLIQATAPLSHSELAEELVPQGHDQATIYRNLTDLTDVGLLNRLDLGDHIWRFEFRRPGHQHDDEHPHFICVDCGEISCLTTVNISFKDGEKSSPLVSEVNEIFLRGRCTKCV